MKSIERNAETSTAKAHFYEEPYEFPSNNFKVIHSLTIQDKLCLPYVSKEGPLRTSQLHFSTTLSR